MSDNIKVVVKVRPLIPREIEDKLGYQWRVNNNTLYQIDQNGRDCGSCFTFDKVYGKDTKTSDVYNDIAKPIVEAATAGFNGTIFAYGQTSSGKTYTMTGTKEAPGILPLAVLNLFDIIKSIPDRDFLVRVSYVEIYNETLIDLLDIKKPIKIQETFQGVKVDATEKVTTSPEEALNVMRMGKANRQTGATNMNEESSRSHSIFQITIESREHMEGEVEVGSVNVSQLNLVDLAGSERSGQTGATGLRFKEGTHINKSLSALALVIKQLSEDPNKHVNYRDSKLTRILQNSLGGNAKTSIICAVTPAAVEETISTLQFANRAKAIKNNPAVNAVATDATMIQTLTKQLSALKTQLENKKSVEQDNCKLQKQISSLQRLILNGFAQRSSTDLCGARRKLVQPRRMTISTLHPIQEDDSNGTSIPKFCTPILKYNPLSISSTSDFVPIQSSSCLPKVPEEVQLITPPPTDKKVNFSDEVILIDSDDDSSSDLKTCSPYHDCYRSTKTPPCVLRKNAKQAEKSLKDIIEFTEREKIYGTDVEELFVKLESKTARLTQLEEELTKLGELSIEKDLEMERLKSNLKKMQDEIKNVSAAKAELEMACKDYNTKLTDWEVSYETLKKKSKCREDELLSLLQETETKMKHEKLGKIASKAIERELTNFMELSRDISLVSSDNENSIINVEDTKSLQIEPLITELQTELTLREQTILELKSELHTHKLKIDSLEIINKELKETISDCKEKLTYIENENSLHKSSIDSLNNVIDNQKSVIDKLNADIVSYNSVIQELQIKLAKKDSTSQDITDNDIEAMIANEEMFIANNENMKNIIQSLKVILGSRNEEIKKLKSSLEKEKPELNIEEELENKKEEIFALIGEVERLKTQSNENVTVIDKLQEEKKLLLTIEQQLKDNVIEIQKEKETLCEQIARHLDEITDLKDCKDKLNLDLDDKERELASTRDVHEKEIAAMSQKITDLENDIKVYDEIIASMKSSEIETQENLERVKSNIQKLNKIMTLFAGSILEVPDKMNCLVTALSMLNDSLTALENLAVDTVVQNKQLVAVLQGREKEINILQSYMNDLNQDVDSFYEEYKNLTAMSNRTELFNKEIKESENDCEHLKNKITNLINIIKSTQIYLNQNLKDKDEKLNEIFLKFEIRQAELDGETSKVVKCTQQIQDITKKRDELLQNILERATGLTSECDIENSISCQFNSNPENTYERIILTLDKVANHVSILKSEREAGNDDIERTLDEAKNEIKQLTEENIKLMQDISNLESSNNVLTSQMKIIQDDSKCLTKDLKESKNLLDELQQNLVSKSNAMNNMESKAMEWKDKFKNFEITMKEQIELLEMENIELKSKCSELEMQDQQKSKIVEKEPLGKSIEYKEVNSPPSLLTICCNRIIDVISINEDDKTVSSVSSTIDIKDNVVNTFCECPDLKSDLDILNANNLELKKRIVELENENASLVKEQDEVQKEVRLLIESTLELQKKLVNHRTNLSTLTATTYAENRSLSSQVKFLQHNHSRFYTVCQRDLPEFKKQLYDLQALLRSEIVGKSNESFKRISLSNALETISEYTPFKNESTIDGDLLMLDTNLTLTTCDNTLLHDQTCFDVTEVSSYHEVACQTNSHEIFKSPLSHPQINKENVDEKKISDTLESLRIENDKLREVVDEYNKNKEVKRYKDAQNSPVKLFKNIDESLHVNNNENEEICKNCKHKEQVRILEEKYKEEIDVMTKKLADLESQKNDLLLEVPSTEALVRKLGALQKDNSQKESEIEKLTHSLNKKREELQNLQEENDQLSNQVMESISEVDDLKKEHTMLKEINNNLTVRFSQLENEIERLKCDTQLETCTTCALKDEMIYTLENKLANSHLKLDRSYSDSESSSRYNKICTLQNELHAGKEDCIELKEQVTTIKNQLERSNLSIAHAMDLDESIGDPHICSFNRVFENVKPQTDKPDIPDNLPTDIYTLDKIDCFNYYNEKTGTDKESFNCDVKILDVMKMLYENISNKHANEVENLMNKLRDFEESKAEIQTQLTNANLEQKRIITELNEKDSYLRTMANVVSEIRHNIAMIKQESFETIITNFSDKFLKKVDKELGFTSSVIFEHLMEIINDKHNEDINKLTIENEKVNDSVERMAKEVETLNGNLSEMKLQLTEREKEIDLLQRQKGKIHEISNAVTLDIVKKERELRDQIIKRYEQLLDSKIIIQNIDVTLPTMEIIKLVFESILNNCKYDTIKNLEKDKAILVLEVDKLKTVLEVKEKELQLLKDEFVKIEDINKNITIDISEKENKLQKQITLHDELLKIHETKVQENNTNVKTIQALTDEVSKLKAAVADKDIMIASLETKLKANIINKENDEKLKDLVQSLEVTKQEIDHLKSINEVILTEKQTCEQELETANAVIKQNKIDFEKLTSDILVLKETVKESSKVTENLRLESKRLLDEKLLLQNNLQEKIKECSCLEENIKKHEKAVELQSGIIIRLKKQKEESVHICKDKDDKIEELKQTCQSLQAQSVELSKELKSSVEELMNCKKILEARASSELESEVEPKPRLSFDISADTSRRRRQSIYDSKRMFADDVEEHNKVEAMFKSRGTAGDMFADVDDNSSDRSTPIHLGRGRDSLLSKHEQSSRDDDSSRPSSVLAARRRRQSAHDLRRSVTHDNSSESSRNNSVESEITQVRKQLYSCQQELEELKERYREVDEECEICAEYLRERDEQCIRLKKEKVTLENTVAELKEKLKNCDPNQINAKTNLVHASVNTDEVCYLHSVVVDRMSYDAEVEKNRKLTKTIEELRYSKHELKKTIAKMQRALEKNTGKECTELEITKAELSACKQELEELKEKYKELDEECETCAEYLRERDEQCRKLKEAKIALEAKLQEYHDLNDMTHSVRKKRQTLHDQNRRSPATLADASTETNDDFLSYQVGKDESSQRASDDSKTEELRRLKMALEKLSHQKTALEHQLVAVSATPLYVATGSAIVQNQQLTDVMKENQKLKKMNSKLITICKKRGKSLADSNRENEDPLNN